MSDLQVHFLGTGDAFCSGGRFQTCFHVTDPDQNFLIDCGATSLMALKINGISTAEIDSIIISHFHGDHFGGLPFLMIDAFFEEHRTKTLQIVGPPGVEARVIASLQNLYPGINAAKFSYQLQFTEFSLSEQIRVGNLHVQAFEVVHAPESLPHAVKIKIEDKTIAFSGDTGWVDNLPQIASGADLFICESNFYDTEIDMHLNYLRIQEAKPDLDCGKLILNHLGTEMLTNLEKVSLDCAHDGMKIQL